MPEKNIENAKKTLKTLKTRKIIQKTWKTLKTPKIIKKTLKTLKKKTKIIKKNIENAKICADTTKNVGSEPGLCSSMGFSAESVMFEP